MVKRLLSALLALFGASALVAQSFPQPPDVQAYVTVAPTYASGLTANVTNTGTPPAYAYQPADISSSQTGYVVVGAQPDNAGGFCTENGTTCTEAKFRSHADCTHTLKDDPIRNYGQPGLSHLHEFFGNRSVNSYSTYASERGRPASNAAGGILNGTGYWFPAPVKTNPFADGHDYAVRCDYAVIYYTTEPTNSPSLVRIPRGLRYVLGTNMDDPDDLIVKAEIAAANAQPGTGGRYSYESNGFTGWYCLNGSNVVGVVHGFLKASDNSDPWGGACTTGMQIYAEAHGPPCWDGQNLWSPGGYKHLRQKIRDNTLGRDVCPNNWYELPALIIKVMFTHQGFSDYGSWRLSSDDMAATNAGHSMRNGESFHTDWLGGWDDATFVEWQTNCLGVGSLGGTPHQCNDSVISSTKRLIMGETAPDGRSPQVDLVTTYGTSSASKMFMVPSSSVGPKTMHVHP
jgi:hypothetical protein